MIPLDLPAAMFDLDARGRITGAAPHLYVVRTPDAVIACVHADLPDDLAASLRAIAQRPRGRPGQWEQDHGDLVAALAAFGPPAALRAGPLYAVPDLPEPPGATALGPADAALLQDGLEEWIPDLAAGLPIAAALADGRAAAVCASVRASATIHCAGVETAPARRGQGHAPRAVAAWARLVRAAGAEPLYATTFDNLASQAVARKLALRLIGSEFSITCRRP